MGIYVKAQITTYLHLNSSVVEQCCNVVTDRNMLKKGEK